MLRRFVRDFGVFLPTQVLPAVIGFVALPFITRGLGATEFGLYSVAFSTVGILAGVSAWVGTAAIRFVPGYSREGLLGDYVRHAFRAEVLTLAALVAVGGLVAVALPLLGVEVPSWTMGASALLVVLGGMAGTSADILRGAGEAWRCTLAKITQALIAMPLAVMVIWLVSPTATGVLGAQALAAGASAVVGWILIGVVVSNTGEAVGGRSNFESSEATRKTLAYSVPLVIGSLASWVLSASDRYILAAMMQMEDVGVYSAAYAVAEKSILMVATLFMLSATPAIFRAHEDSGGESASDLSGEITGLYVVGAGSVVFAIFAVAPEILSFLLGSEYAEAWPVIVFVSAGAWLIGLQQRFHAPLLVHNRPGPILRALLIASAVNLPLTIVLVKLWGINGAGLATLVSYAVLLAAIVAAKGDGLVWAFPWISLWLLLPAGCVGVAVGRAALLWGHDLPVMAQVLLGAFACLLAMGVLLLAAVLLLPEKSLAGSGLVGVRRLGGRMLSREGRH